MSSVIVRLLSALRSTAARGSSQSSARSIAPFLSTGSVHAYDQQVCFATGHSPSTRLTSLDMISTMLSRAASAAATAASAVHASPVRHMHAGSNAPVTPPRGSLHVPGWLRETLSKQLQTLVDKLPKGPPVVLVDVTVGHAGSSLLPIVAPAASASGSVLRIIYGDDFLKALKTDEQQGAEGQDSGGSTGADNELLVPTRNQLSIGMHECVVVFSMPPWLDYSTPYKSFEDFMRYTSGVYSARWMRDAVAALAPDSMLIVHPASLLTNKSLWTKAAMADELRIKDNTLSALAARYRLEAPCIFPASAIAPAIQADTGLVASLYTRPGSISWDDILATPMHVLPKEGTWQRALVLGRLPTASYKWHGWWEAYNEAVKDMQPGKAPGGVNAGGTTGNTDSRQGVPDMPTGIAMDPFNTLNELLQQCEVSDIESEQAHSTENEDFDLSLPCPIPLSAVPYAAYAYCVQQHFGDVGIYGGLPVIQAPDSAEEWFEVACMVHMILHDPHTSQLHACQRPTDPSQQQQPQQGALWRALQTTDIEYALQALSELHQDDSLPAAAAARLPDLYGDALRWLRGEAAGPSKQVVQATGQWFKDYFAQLKEDVIA